MMTLILIRKTIIMMMMIQVTHVYYEECSDHALRIKIDFDEFPLDPIFQVSSSSLLPSYNYVIIIIIICFLIIIITIIIMVLIISERLDIFGGNLFSQCSLSRSLPQVFPWLGKCHHQVSHDHHVTIMIIVVIISCHHDQNHHFSGRFENILTSHDFGYGKTGSVVAFGGVEYCYKVGHDHWSLWWWWYGCFWRVKSLSQLLSSRSLCCHHWSMIITWALKKVLYFYHSSRGRSIFFVLLCNFT